MRSRSPTWLPALLLLPACPADSSDDDGGGSSGVDSGTAGTPMTSGSTGGASGGETQPGPDSTDEGSGTAEAGTTMAVGGSSGSSTGPGPGGYMFLENLPNEYVQIDRAGFPAINTALNLLGDKDAYNASNPAEDITSSTAVDNLVDSLDTLHEGPPGGVVPDNTGLDDELSNDGFAPCSVTGINNQCGEQVAPFALPDTLNLQLGNVAPFPNGRRPEEQVIDRILAIVLLDLTMEGQTRFLDLDDDLTLGDSLNPFTNDVPFSPFWPYLAPAHP